MRGDPPHNHILLSPHTSSTPHARGSTLFLFCRYKGQTVYPACAGIHPFPAPCLGYKPRLPRMRGDPPAPDVHIGSHIGSTPHARGSTVLNLYDTEAVKVYPACAGIHLLHKTLAHYCKRLPRMRGDPPKELGRPFFPGQSTPHARGSTLRIFCAEVVSWVYPACAGIHLQTVVQAPESLRLPRMRGDPPQTKKPH